MAKVPHVPDTPSGGTPFNERFPSVRRAQGGTPPDVDLVASAQGDDELQRSLQLFAEQYRARAASGEAGVGPMQAMVLHIKEVQKSNPELGERLAQFVAANKDRVKSLAEMAPVGAGDAAAPTTPANTQAAPTPTATASQPAAPAAPGGAPKGAAVLPGGMRMVDAAAIVFRDGIDKLPPDVAAAIASDPKLLKSLDKAVERVYGSRGFVPLAAQDGKLSGGQRGRLAPQTGTADIDLVRQVLRHQEDSRVRQEMGLPPLADLDASIMAKFAEWERTTSAGRQKNMRDHAAKASRQAAGLSENGATPPPPPPPPPPPNSSSKTNVDQNLDSAVGSQNVVSGPEAGDPPIDPGTAETPAIAGLPEDRFSPIDPETAESIRADLEREAWGQGKPQSFEGSPSHPSNLDPDADLVGDAHAERLAEKWRKKQGGAAAKGEAPSGKQETQANPGASPESPASPPQPGQPVAPSPGEGKNLAAPQSGPPQDGEPRSWIKWMQDNKWRLAAGIGGAAALYALNQKYPVSKSGPQAGPSPPPPGPPGGSQLPPMWSDQLQDEDLRDYLHRRARASGVPGNAPGLPFHVGATAGRYGS